MNRLRKLAHPFFIFLLAGILGVVVPAQMPFTKKIKRNGWVIPVISSLEIGDKEQIEVDGFFVQRTNFKLRDPKPYLVFDGGRKCEYRFLSSYSTAGETFAIGGECIRFGIDPRYGKFYIGAISKVTFTDNDGDGKFEERVSAARSMLIVPDRLKKETNRVPPPPSPPLPPKRPST